MSFHNARLVSITPNAEKLIAYCARVSSPNQSNKKIEKLLAYCAAKKHWSVYEMAHMTLEINTTRAIEPQILRHKSFSFQSFSQRYSDVGADSDNPLPSLINSIDALEFRLQDYKNRQNSIEMSDEEKQSKYVDSFLARSKSLAVAANKLYSDMIKTGIAFECARNILPAAQPTRLYMSGNIRSWIHYLQIRTEGATQKEHRMIAESALLIFKENLPLIAKTLFEND